jgi:hypothetical protein
VTPLFLNVWKHTRKKYLILFVQFWFAWSGSALPLRKIIKNLGGEYFEHSEARLDQRKEDLEAKNSHSQANPSKWLAISSIA